MTTSIYLTPKVSSDYPNDLISLTHIIFKKRPKDECPLAKFYSSSNIVI